MKIVQFQVLPKDVTNRVYSELYVLDEDGQMYTCLLNDRGMPDGKDPWSKVKLPKVIRRKK